jgi:hypothetical protein
MGMNDFNQDRVVAGMQLWAEEHPDDPLAQRITTAINGAANAQGLRRLAGILYKRTGRPAISLLAAGK